MQMEQEVKGFHQNIAHMLSIGSWLTLFYINKSNRTITFFGKYFFQCLNRSYQCQTILVSTFCYPICLFSIGKLNKPFHLFHIKKNVSKFYIFKKLSTESNDNSFSMNFLYNFSFFLCFFVILFSFLSFCQLEYGQKLVLNRICTNISLPSLT